MKHLVTLSLLFLCARAWSCSCGGIASIDEAIAYYPILVEAEVVSLEEVNSPEYGRQVHSVTLQVKTNLKGASSSETITVGHSMCYASLYPELMKLRHTYVLPLAAPREGRYAMAHCAHSGMELIDGKLYTFEQTEGLARKLRFYKNYSDFQRRLKK
jgi:hypothetical protein